MEKNNIAWVFVRAIGVYFTAHVFIQLYNVSALVFAITKFYDIAKFKEEVNMEIIRMWVNIGIYGIQLIVFIFLAYYCLRKGAYIHKLLMYTTNNEKT